MSTRMNILNITTIDVLKVEESEYDFIFTVKTLNPPIFCPKCFCKAEGNIHKHGSRERIIRDVHFQNKRVGIRIEHQRYKCLQCGSTFYEELDFVDKDGKMTVRLRDYLKKLAIKKPFAEIAEEYGLSHTIIRDIFKEFVEENETDKVIVAPAVLGIDEAHLNKVMRGVYCNVEKNMIIELTESRSKKEVIKFIKSMCNYENIEIVTCDMWRPYIEAAYETIPNVVVVIDRYHVVKMAIIALDTIRKQLKDNLDKGQKRLLMRERYVLLHNQEDLTPEQIRARDKWFYLFPKLKEAYYLKEDFRNIYNADSRQEAEELFNIWCGLITEDTKQFREVAKTVNAFRKEIFNYFECGYTNAFTESTNSLIKLIEKNGRGYSFEILRAKVLFGTRATKKPKFGTGTFKTIGNMMESYYYQNHKPMKPILLYSEDESDSFGVDIPTLKEVLENGEF